MSWLDQLKQWLIGPEPDFTPSIPEYHTEEHRLWEAGGRIDYKTTPGVYVYREDRGIGVVVRIFVSGNRSLRRFNDFPHDDHEDPGCMTREQYKQFRLDLLKLMYPTDYDLDLSDKYLAVYKNYIRLQQPWVEGMEVPDFMDDEVFLIPVLAVLQRALGWDVMPTYQETGAYGPPVPDGAGKHWHLGRH